MILDGDGIITTPQLLTDLCEFTGMDRSKLEFEWAPATEPELDQLAHSTMQECEGPPSLLQKSMPDFEFLTWREFQGKDHVV